MNLTKALKTKKKLVKQVDEAYTRFLAFNSHEAGMSTPYNAEEAFNAWLDLTKQLIDLKTKIQLANAPIAEKIFRLGELKNLSSRMRNVDVKEGMHRDRYTNDGTQIEYVAFMNLVAKDKQVKQWEAEIEALQEEIEAFNAITKI
jgi:hypothetical protein